MTGGAASGGLSPLGLCRLLIGLRLRLLRNRLAGGPQVATARLAALVGLLVPLAYLGLFATAFEVLGLTGGVAVQGRAVALVATAIALSSCALKIAGREAVTGMGGESAFLLTRPVSLSSLVLARGLAGVATDLYDAFFLVPILAAAAVAWNLGLAGFLLAAVASVFVQMAVTAVALAAQILVVRLVPPGRRRLLWTAGALTAAAAMAGVWMGGSAVLRAPAAPAQLLAEQAWIGRLPGGLIAAPLVALREGAPLRAAGALLVLAAGSAAALALSWTLARLCARGGWEQADAPWVGGARPAGSGARLTLFGKDWRLFRRDPVRLAAFLAMPLLFVGMQVFGSAGWSWLRGDATRVALLAYSLAAYAATFGPLQHMAAEGRAFWILRTVPVPLGRLLAGKAAFQTSLVAGMAAAVYLLLALLAGVPAGAAAVGLGLLVVAGAAVVSWLAVGLAAEVADLSDERRPGVGIGTTYLFLLVAGLFNVALLQPSPDRLRALLLYLIAAGTAWTAGVERAALAFDAEATRRRVLSPTVGALAAVSLFLGERATTSLTATLGGAEVAWAQLAWMVLVGLAALAHRRRSPPSVPPRGGALRAGVLALGVGLLGALAVQLSGLVRPVDLPLAALLTRALAQEVVVRGVFQAGLARPQDGGSRRVAVAAVSALVAWSAGAGPTCIAAVAPAAVAALTGRLWPALVTRALLEILSVARLA